ncbi:MAG: helix-turn-helix transcriptional regulator [Clostridiales bacterium]|nr:helix-turn-helix transcriptional regulator [Clostridiales bacterium]
MGKRLKELRELKGLTQQELAGIMNLSQQTIGHYEVGRAKPDADTLNLLISEQLLTTSSVVPT